jgi:hypothetical protein
MTIAIGALYSDGIIVAADTKVVFSDGSTDSESKIFRKYVLYATSRLQKSSAPARLHPTSASLPLVSSFATIA